MVNGNMGVGGSNIGFMLSFIDNASKPIMKVTHAYERMTKAMDSAEKAAGDTNRFNQGMNKIAKGLQNVTQKGQGALSSIAAFASLSRGKLGNIKVNIASKIPRLTPMAKGGIVTGPTPALLGEAGPEAVIPLGRGSSDFSKMAPGFKFMDRAFKSFRRIKDSWRDSFGPGAKRMWKGITRSSKPFFRGLKDVIKGGALLQAGEALDAMKNNMSQVVSEAGEFAGSAEAAESFAKNTKDIAASLGMSRKELKVFRKEWAGTLSLSEAQVSVQAETTDKLMQQGFTLKDNVGLLSESLALIYEATQETADLTDLYSTLVLKTGLSQEYVAEFGNTLLTVTQKMRRGGLRLNFEELSSAINESAGALRDVTAAFPERERRAFVESLSSIEAGFQAAGMEGGQLTQMMTQFIQGGIDEKVGMAAFGMSAKSMTKALKEGNVAEIIQRMSMNMRNIDPTNMNAGLEAIQEIAGFDMAALTTLSNNFDKVQSGATKFNEAMRDTVVTNEDLGETVKSQRTLYENLKESMNKVLLSVPGFIHLQAVMEDVNFLQLFGFIEVMKGVKGLIGPMWKLVKKTKEWTGVQTAFNAVMSMNPIALIVIGVAALTTAIVIAWKKSETFRNIVIGLWDSIKSLAATIWDFLTPAIDFVKNRFMVLMGPVGWAIEAFKHLKGMISKTPAGKGFFGWIKKGIDVLMKPLGWLWDKIKGIWDLIFKKKSGQGGITQESVVPNQASGIKLAPQAQLSNKVEPPSKRDKIEVDQTEVVDVLEKILSAILNLDRGGRRGGYAIKRSSETISPALLAVNGEI